MIESSLAHDLVPISSDLRPATNQEVVVYSRKELNKAQRDWLKERDLNCQFPFPHECTPDELQLHHVDPMHWAMVREHKDAEEINDARNVIRLCKAIHIGDLRIPADPEMLHPDHRQALLDYQVDRHSFQDVAERHGLMTQLGLRYWFAGNDDYLADIADFRTRMKERKYQDPYPRESRQRRRTK